MEKEIIETVLTDISEDIRHYNELNKENSKVVFEMKTRLLAIEKKFDNASKPLGSADIREIEKIISDRFDSLRAMHEERPEKKRSEFRILLFPEHNTREYYKVVFGRIIFWLVILVLAKYAYTLGHEWIRREYEGEKYKKAWENLYKRQEKGGQKMMQRIIEAD
jgi:tryptophan 2,3-dioxygenase